MNRRDFFGALAAVTTGTVVKSEARVEHPCQFCQCREIIPGRSICARCLPFIYTTSSEPCYCASCLPKVAQKRPRPYSNRLPEWLTRYDKELRERLADAIDSNY